MPEQHTDVDAHQHSHDAHEALDHAAQAVDAHVEHAESALAEHEGDVHNLAADVEHGAHDAAHAVHDHGRHVSHPPEFPNFVQIWFASYKEDVLAEGGSEADVYGRPKDGLNLVQTLHVGRLEKPAPFVDYMPWENNLFAAIAMLAVVVITWLVTRPFRRSKEEAIRNPTRCQVAVEMLVDGVDNFCKGILGEENGRRYMPYVTGLFFFILAMNLMGIVPLMKAPTASLLITGSLALCTFLYYQYVAWTRLGPVHYIKHLCGNPQSAVQWCLAPLMFIIECVSDFGAKPLSLALRLFGNILGKDILLGVMLLLGLMASKAIFGGLADYWGIFGSVLTFPFYFLALLLSTIQALVFALLSAIYILMVLPHDHDHGEHDEHHHAEAHAH